VLSCSLSLFLTFLFHARDEEEAGVREDSADQVSSEDERWSLKRYLEEGQYSGYIDHSVHAVCEFCVFSER
jgi:hypothetical protein